MSLTSEKPGGDSRPKVTIETIQEKKQRREPITCLTAYDYAAARLVDEAGVDMVLVGDSLAMVMLGYENTLPVTMEEMLHHTRAARRGVKRALLIADMPYASFHISKKEALRNAARFVKEAGAEAVKVEGGEKRVELVKRLLDAEIPVMGHIGLTPQSIHAMGGYKVQGKAKDQAEILLNDAEELENAGAFAIVLECVPAELAKRITETISIPTIGIGAGPHCDGQVLVINDMLGLDTGIPRPRFVQRYADLNGVISSAVAAYIKDVEDGDYPAKKHCY